MTALEAISYGYQMPTRILFGEGSLSRLAEVIGNPKARVLVVSGRSAMRRTGVLERVEMLLGKDRTVLYDRVLPNPTPELVDEAVAVFRDNGCDIVVGIGGGSVLDVAKSVAILQAHPRETRAYLNRQAILKNQGVDCIAIPTTAGTGSEVTPWATIWDMQVRRKYSLENKTMFPTSAIIDPTLASSLSPLQTAASGMDALTQALEAYWARSSQPISDMFALDAVRAILGNLESAVGNGLTVPPRVAMAHGSMLAGLAFSNTKTTICHALSYPMTAQFGVSHGQAVSITLAPFLLWNAEAISSKLLPLLDATGARCIEDLARRIQSLMSTIGLATRLSHLGLSINDLDLIVEQGLDGDRASNNPRPVSFDDARSILVATL